MKKVNRRVEDWSTHGSPMALQSSPYLISNELTARVLLPELDHVMWLSRSAELGIVVLDRAGFVVGVNLAARELLATDDGLSQAGRGVEACLPQENETLAAAIRLGVDRAGRNTVRRRIASNKSKLWGDDRAITALEDFLEKVARDV